ncbi:MAG: hypothetical protein QME94_06945, partial [Anaerolineae bacterium]|nr:hypothetical protein [Anaerolineae bacterium]
KVAAAAGDRLAAALEAAPGVVRRRAELPEWRLADGRLEVQTPHYALELAEEAGGGIVRAWCPATRDTLLAGLSNDLVCYRDSGGLWRMGHEFRGGSLRQVDRAGERPARLEVRELPTGLEVSCVSQVRGGKVQRLGSFRADSPVIRFRVQGRAPEGCTVTASFATGLCASRLCMDVPGGVVIRPPQKVYAPTFWPMQSFWHAQDDGSGRGIGLLVGLPGASAYRPDGSLEAVALRNATRERAWGLLPIPATPATGHERHTLAFDYALLFTRQGDWRDNRLPTIAQEMRQGPWQEPGRQALWELAAGTVTVDRDDVFVTAIKPASRGQGIILRLYSFEPTGTPVRLGMPGGRLAGAFLCDARERDLQPLQVREGAVWLAMPGAVATVRLLPDV